MDAYQEQKDVYRAVVATVGVGDLAALDVLLARDLIDHNPMPGQVPGIDGFKQWASAVRSSFPDFRGSVETVLAEGNLVAGQVIWRGTQRGWFLGVPPSDRQVEISAFHVVRFSATGSPSGGVPRISLARSSSSALRSSRIRADADAPRPAFMSSDEPAPPVQRSHGAFQARGSRHRSASSAATTVRPRARQPIPLPGR